jgi:AcrR family transcriptional regulator
MDQIKKFDDGSKFRRKNEYHRLSKQRWTAQGLKVLGQKGVGSIRIDDLCHQLKVTKGSFYWHFRDKADYLRSVLDHWAQSTTQEMIDRVEARSGSPIDKISSLYGEANSGIVDFHAEQAVRHWARSDKSVSSAVLNVDEIRLAYLEALFTELGFSDSESETKSRLLYSLILGEAMIYRREPAARRKKRQRRCFDAVIQPAGRIQS